MYLKADEVDSTFDFPGNQSEKNGRSIEDHPVKQLATSNTSNNYDYESLEL